MRLRCAEMSTPSSCNACTAYPLGGWPSIAPTPAENARKSPRPLTACRKSPSAIGLRQTFPVQTKRMVFIARDNYSNLGRAGQKSTAKSAGVRSLDDCDALQQIKGPRQRRVAYHVDRRVLVHAARGQ